MLHRSKLLNEKTIYKFIKLVFFQMNVSIYILLIVGIFIDYNRKRQFLISNPLALLCSIVIISLVFLSWGKVRGNLKIQIKKNAFNSVLILTTIMFFVQLYIGYHIFFLSGWDVGAIISFIRIIINGDYVDNWYWWYYSAYQNNITITWIFYKLILISNRFNVLNYYDGVMLIVMFNCLISSITSVILYKSVEILKNEYWAIISWFIFVIFIGINPWMIITYSDQIALIFPILIFYLYLITQKRKFQVLLWFIIGLISFIGYSIKPHVIIMLLSIILIEITRFFFSSEKKENVKYLMIITSILFSFIISRIINYAIINDLDLIIDDNARFSWLHYMMLGVNDFTDGTWNEDDVLFSSSFMTQEERNSGNIRIIKERLNDLSFTDFMKFMARKALTNYGDGTFAWSFEGNFYAKLYPNNDEKVSSFLRSYYYEHGENYPKTSALQQTIWVSIITFMLGFSFICENEFNRMLAILMLAIIGLTMFVMIFEARARYLYSYSPIFILLGIVGLAEIYFVLSKLRLRNIVSKK